MMEPEENISVVAAVDDYIISSDSRGVFKVIEKSELAFHAVHFGFSETATGNTGSAALGALGFCLISRIWSFAKQTDAKTAASGGLH